MVEEERRQKTSFHIVAIIITAVVVALAVFFGIQIFTRTGAFKEPGKIVYGEGATEVIQDFVNSSLEGKDLPLEEDLTIETIATTNRNPQFLEETTCDDNSVETNCLPKSESETKTASDYLLYDIQVVVTDFYNPISNIASSDVDSLLEKNEIQLIPFDELSASAKLLSLDGQYFLDEFDSGAYFNFLKISGKAEDVVKITTLIKEALSKFPSKNEILTLAQTGVTALSRGMNRKLTQVGDAKYFSENIAELLSGFDFTHTSNESSFSNSASAENICSNPKMIDVLTSIGLDIVELTGNHNQDCGDNDAIATIDLYNSLGIKTFGGGKTAADAAVPLEISAKNIKITLLGYNFSTGGYTTDNTPGANFYTEEKAAADIAAAKARGDFIIVDVQFYECSSYASTTEDPTCDRANSSAGDQISFFRHLIDLGANIVVGTAAHQPQTFELYKDGAIYYGLGNLFFDQSWWPGTTRSLILAHYFYNGKHLQTRIIPTVYDSNYQTKLMDPDDARNFIERLENARP